MPLDAANFHALGPVKSNDMLQFYNLATGVMVDQPVTYRNALSIGGNQGQTTVPLKIYGATGQNTNLIDLYVDRSAAQPGFGFSAIGSFSWGPGGVAPQDTFMSRVAMQNGHVSDTPGLLVTPLMEVDGALTVDGLTTLKGGLASGGGPLNLAGNTSITGTLLVSGATTLQSTLAVTGLATFTGGITTGAGGLTVGNTQINGTLNVTGATVLAGVATAGSTLHVNGVINANANMNLPGGASITGLRYTMQGGASVIGNGGDRVRLLNHLDVDYDVVVGRNHQVNGSLNVNANINNPWLASQGGVVSVAAGAPIYWPSAGVGGRPTYVIGQANDGYFHWYAANSIGPPSGVAEIIGTNVASSYPDGVTATRLSTITVNRTGYWGATYVNTVNSISDHSLVDLRFAGTTRYAGDFYPSGGGKWSNSVSGQYLISAGQTIEVYGHHSYNGGYNIESQTLRAWFIPVQDYPN